MTNYFVSLILLREDTPSLIRSFYESKGEEPSFLTPPESNMTFEGVFDFVRQWRIFPELNWCLHGRRKREATWSGVTAEPSFTSTPSRRSSSLREVAQLFEWSILPWGIDYTALILAFVTYDQRTIEKFNEIMSEVRDGDSFLKDHVLSLRAFKAGILLSTYTADEVDRGIYRGAVFTRLKSSVGRGLWLAANCANDSPCALVRLQKGSMPEPLASCKVTEVVGVDAEVLGTAVRHSCFRLLEERSLLTFAQYEGTAVIVPSEVGERHGFNLTRMWENIKGDPLAFGIHLLSFGEWLYAPSTPREHFEVFFHRDGNKTRDLLSSREVAEAEYFAFCSFF